MLNSKLLSFFTLTILLAIKSLSAETVSFDLNQFTVDSEKQKIFTQRSDTTHSKSYRNFRVPVLVSMQTALYAVPEKLELSNLKLKPVLTGIEYRPNNTNSLLQNYEEYSNSPVAIGVSGFARGNGILNLEFTPFVFRQDTLFFVESLDYQLSCYQQPLRINSKAGEECDLLIIGSRICAEKLAEYAQFKQQNGLKTEIAFVEDIIQSSTGKNSAYKIRNYIKDFYRNKNIRFVLLAGSNFIIPVVVFKNSSSDEATPSDQFYSNLDKDFDSNNNGIYADNADVVDYLPDLQIGRWPVSTANEVQLIVDKTLSYFAGNISDNPNYYRSLALVAFDLQNPGDSETYCEAVKLAAGSNMQPDSLYQSSTPGFSFDKVYGALNSGSNFIYIQAHGSLNKFGVMNGWGIFSDHIYYTTGVSGLYFIASCHPGDFLASGLVIKAMLAPLGGCINYIGTSGSEYPNMTEDLHTIFVNQLVTNQTIGYALDYARRAAFPNLMNEPVSRQLYYGYSLQGDPSNYLYMQEPENNSIKNLSSIKRGSGSVNGTLALNHSTPITITLYSGDKFLATTTIADTSFSINYSNLFEDSVTIAVSSPDILFKKATFPTESNNQDIQVKSLEIKDFNHSNFVENLENFKITLKLNSNFNQPLTDSLKVVFSCTSNILRTTLADTATIVWPVVGADADYELFDLSPEFINLKSDTSLVFNFKIVPLGSGGLKTPLPIFERDYLLPVANPRLEVSWVKYPDANTVKPVLVNTSAGKIDQAGIKLFGTKQPGSEGDSYFVLHNISGNAILIDSLQFSCNINADQKLEIVQNNTPVYFSKIFKKSVENVTNIDTLKTGSYNIGSDLFLRWNKYKSSIGYNLFVYENDTLVNVSPVNKYPLTTPEYQYSLSEFNLDNNAYIKISLIDRNSLEAYAVSKFIKINTVPQYGNAPYSLHPFQLYNPVNINDKIVANSQNGAVVSIPADGSTFSGDGTIFQQTSFGFENDFLQGKAFGDLDSDGQTEIVHMAYACFDSVYLQVVNLVSGQILAKKRVYGYALFNTPVLANIDTDPEPEILFSTFNDNLVNVNRGSYIYAFDYQAGELIIKPGYPIFSANISNLAVYCVGAPSVADLDHNGTKELVFNQGKFVEVYDLNSRTKITELELGSNLTNDLAMCDLDNDQTQEIICIQANISLTSTSGKLRVLKFTDSSLVDFAGFLGGKTLALQASTIYNKGPGPVVSDIDKDGNPEIIALTGKKLYVFNNNGSSFTGFPVTLPASITNSNLSCPSLADLNGDSKLDLVFMDANSYIHGYSGSSSILPGFPLFVPNALKNNYGSINIADLDHDNDLEILAGNRNGNLYIFDYPLPTTNRQIYSYHRADLANSGLFIRSDLVSPINSENLPSKFTVINQYPNPFNPVTTINFFIPNPENVKFRVFNVAGQLVYQHDANYINSGIKSIEFNGADLGSGLYIYSLKYGNEIRNGKCTLLK